MKIMRGDARRILFGLRVDGETLTDAMVGEVEVTVGHCLRKTLSAGEVKFDKDTAEWYFRLTQENTLNLPLESLDVVVRPKFLSATGTDEDVIGVRIGRLLVTDGQSKVVL